jgi:hypothetical protein
MIKILQKGDSLETPILGGFCPYWTVLDGSIILADTAEEIINFLPPQKRAVDPVSILEFLRFNYMLGNRTLVQGVQRMPLRATLNADGTLIRRPPIPHGNLQLESGPAAIKLHRLLSDELTAAIRNRKRIFMLLSGGLDSRVIAGVLKEIEPKTQVKITCVTWGHPESRDVNYAQRIAGWYGWDFVNVPIDAGLTWKNIERGAIWGGSEATGIHLHGMDWFTNANRDDLVISGSFGDGIGRGEFSSTHLTHLKFKSIINTWDLVYPWIANKAINIAERDRCLAWEGAESESEYAHLELDMEENFARRMMAHVMNYIRQYCDLYQPYANAELVTFMWSLAPGHRTDDIYFNPLKNLDPRLYSLPWARTGIAPDGNIEPNTNLTKHFHKYFEWLRKDLYQNLESIIFDRSLNGLELFNSVTIKKMWDAWVRSPDFDREMGENLVKICSIELSHRHFNLLPCRKSDYWQDYITYTLRNSFTNGKKVIWNIAHIARRKIKIH